MSQLTTIENFETSASAREQVVFTGTTDCKEFAPNFLRADKCTNCYKNIFSHHSSAVCDDRCILEALEWSAKKDKEGSTILSPEEDLGGLYLGSFRATFGQQVLTKHKVTLVVNTAKGLATFWPAYKRTEERNKKNGIEYCHIPWVDSDTQVLEKRDLNCAIQRIHQHRLRGNGVVVHCAQGKSRSSTLVIAYLCSIFKWSVDKSLEWVKSKRLMAQPNKGFISQLLEFEKEQFYNTIIPTPKEEEDDKL